MANLKEQEKWEDGVYQIEENDPVLGGENGITNKPIKQLANRTLWLKKTLELFGKKSTPKDLVADSTSTADGFGHSHKLPLASISDKGIVKLNSQTASDSEQDAATPKAVKAAYDKGVEAKNTADNANQNAEGRVSKSGDTMTGDLLLKKGDYSGLNLYNNDDYYIRIEGNPNNSSYMLTLVYRTPKGGNLAVATLPKKNGVIAYTEDVVSKNGDTMTGILRTVGIASTHFGAGAYSNQYTSGAPFMVETTGSQDRDTYHPFVKGLVRSRGRYGAGFSFGYTTKQGAGDGFGRGIIHLIEDNGKNITWNFEHNGDFIASGDVRTGSRSLNKTHQTDFNYVTVKQSGNYAGLNIDRQDGKHARFELVGYHFKLWVEDRYEINFPERGGTVLLDTDFSYQKIGNFEVRKYPDGTMIQTYAVNVGEHQLTTDKLKTFNWAVAFASTPMIWVTANATDNRNGAQVDLGALVGIVLSDCTQATCAYRTSEIWQDRNHNPTMQFLAIGRWK